MKLLPVGRRSGGSLKMGESTTAAYVDKNGVAFGTAGSTVIAGHSNHKGYAAFNHLADVRSGDFIVISGHGQVLHYQLSSKRIVPIQNVGNELQKCQVDGGPSTVCLETCYIGTYDWSHLSKWRPYNYYTQAVIAEFELVS